MSIASRRHRGRSRAQTVVDITSLLDVVFLLIIFLIVSTTFRKSEHAFVVELPTSGTEVVEVTTDKTTVYVNRRGEFFLIERVGDGPDAAPAAGSDRPLSRAELEARLKALHAATPDLPIAVRGEKDASYQTLMDVVGALQGVGFKSIYLPYELAQEPAAP
jgi:biopolymer transport protein ExbD